MDPRVEDPPPHSVVCIRIISNIQRYGSVKREPTYIHVIFFYDISEEQKKMTCLYESLKTVVVLWCRFCSSGDWFDEGVNLHIF